MDKLYANTLKRIEPPRSLPDQKNSVTSDFLKSLKFATSKKDEKALTRKNIWGRVVEEENPSKEYIGVQYQVGGQDAPVRNMYLVRYGRQGNDKIWGAELDDGRSLSAEGTKRLLNNIYEKGGTIVPLSGKDNISKIGSARNSTSATQGALQDAWGVLKALRNMRWGL